MKAKKGSRAECYDATVVLKKSTFIVTKSDSVGFSKLLWQAKKLKLLKMLGDGQRTILSNLQNS